MIKMTREGKIGKGTDLVKAFQPTPLFTAVQLALIVSTAQPVLAQSFPAEVELSSVDGTNGFVINGEAGYDKSGISVSGVGDFNGDGIEDLLIGAEGAKPNGYNSGRTYVLFGSNTDLPNPLELSSVNGVNGFAINGEAKDDESGRSVSNAGDINGDGIEDLIIGAWRNDPNGFDSGRCYVVFGSDSGLPHPLELSDLNGTNGFAINGESAGDRSGYSVSGVGDINDDGIDDLGIGASSAGINGRSYVIFGNSNGFSSSIELSELNGSNGFAIEGEEGSNGFGENISDAGDINGDGIDDLVIGAPSADPNGDSSGRSYVLFGSSAGFESPFDLSNLDGTNGFAISGERMFHQSGKWVAGAGDINGDGIDDLIVASSYTDRNGEGAGISYAIFGSYTNLPHPFELSGVDGTNGFVIDGENAYDYFGISSSGAGDINDDGIDDLIIGASGSDINGSGSGRTYVVFGSTSGFPSPLKPSSLDGFNGFVLNGEIESDSSGRSVGGIGDFNNDGLDDFIIGAPRADPNDISSAGRSYVIFGSDGLFNDGFEDEI